jgi:hypothetical protein
MDLIYSTVGFFVTGGAFMYPILTVFAIGASIAIERYITLTRITNRNQSVGVKYSPHSLRATSRKRGNSPVKMIRRSHDC